MSLKRKAIGLSLAIVMVLTAACSKVEKNEQGESTNSPERSTESKAVEENFDPLGKYDTPVTMTIGKGVYADDKSLPSSDTVDNNQFTRYFEEKLNLKFKAAWVTTLGEAYDQKLALAISSNDLPDAMVVSEREMRLMVKSGQLEDLSKVYEQYGSPLLKKLYAQTEGKALESATFDGKLMALPNLNVEADAVQMLWVRQDWLDKLGLQPPKTVDELGAIAKAFIEQDPDGNGKPDTLGLLGPNFIPIYTAFQSYPSMWTKNAEGKISYGSIAPEAKQALAKLRDWYSQGIVDKEFALRKDMWQLLNGGRAGLFFSVWAAPWLMGDSVKNNPNAVWKAYALPLDGSGTFNATMGPVSSQYYVVKKGYSNPEALVKYVNLYTNVEYDPEAISKLINEVNAIYYPLRTTMTDPKAVTTRLQHIRQVLDGTLKESELDPTEKDVYDKIRKENEKPLSDIGNWMFSTAYQVGGGALESPMNKVYNAFYSQTKSMGLKLPALSKLESETFTKIIMGREPIESFDSFVEEWKRSGGDQITKEIEEELSGK